MEYENKYASKGVAGTGLGLGIAGTALGLLNGNGLGILNGNNGNYCGCSENFFSESIRSFKLQELQNLKQK